MKSFTFFRAMVKRLLCSKILQAAFILIVIANVFYISTTVVVRESFVSKKIVKHTYNVLSSLKLNSHETEKEVFTKFALRLPQTRTIDTNILEDQHYGNLYEIPNVPYEELTDKEKIYFQLNKVAKDNKKYWLGDTQLHYTKMEIKVDEFKKEYWTDNPALFYDPRFTLSMYISEIKNQLLSNKDGEVVLPFAWSDWVDITMLNEELKMPPSKRKNCAYMKATHHAPAKNPNYCINIEDITERNLRDMGLPSIDFIPGFVIKESPTNKASNEVRMLEGKSHLLTYARNPLSIIFLTDEGVYEAKIDKKQRIVDTNIFENFLNSHDIQSESIVLDPVEEFNDLISKVSPQKLAEEDDIHGLKSRLMEKNIEKSRELHLPEEIFDYQEEKVTTEIQKYEERFKEIRRLTTNELIFDASKIEDLRLTRNERIHYDGMRFSRKYKPKKEPTYFRMARLNFDTPENDKDAGWHYEWRFFNGALRYMKKGWNKEELLIREKILLDRILRNWFKFANEKGIISWIAHGPLLSWYWDGLMFPFDEDIDVQMPIEELVRFSKLYNQTLVIENIAEGYGKYFIDCSNFIYHRGKSYKQNHIDARFIDIDTGGYIDITGLGISDEEVPERYKEISERAIQEGKSKPVYNCRNLHFYSHEEISPLRLTSLGGVPVFIPNRVESILKEEYDTGMSDYDFEGFYFVDAINLWVHESKLEFLFKGQNFKDRWGATKVGQFTKLVQSIDETKVVELLEHDEDILIEYYITKDVTDMHKKELTYLFDLPQNENTPISEIGTQKSDVEIANDINYHKLTSQIKMKKPFRRAIFNYENIDRPKHHTE